MEGIKNFFSNLTSSKKKQSSSNSYNSNSIDNSNQAQQQYFQQSMFQQSTQNPNVKPVNVFNDDDKLIEAIKGEIKQSKIQIKLKGQRTLVKLKQKCYLPVMCEVKTEGGVRSSVDLICVLDVSGSMSGQKIQLLKETMKFLVETLTPSDRLCIITFNNQARRICTLKALTKQNIEQLNKHIDSITAGGGTNILSGLQTALKVMRQRKFKNQVTSVFLLSDGQDNMGIPASLEMSLKKQQNITLDTFSIQSFGFGNDHNEDLMSNIAKVMDGNFFFIKQFSILDEAFCNALGGIISVAAKQMKINIKNISENLMEGVRISKVYGKMWTKVNDKEYTIKTLQLMSGMQKNYILELQIPNIQAQIGDIQRDHNILECTYQITTLTDQLIKGQTSLQLTLLNQNQVIPQINENIDVLEHYLRLKAAESIEESIKQAEMNNYQVAQKNLDKVIQTIQSDKRVRQKNMEFLMHDLKRARNNCQKVQFQSYGRKEMRNFKEAHEWQKGHVMNDCYQNSVQTEMLSNMRAKKR